MGDESTIEAIDNPVARSPGRQTTFDVEDTSPPSTASDAGALDLLERGGIAAVANAHVDDQASLLIMDDDAPSISALKDVLRLITVSHTLGSSGMEEHIPTVLQKDADTEADAIIWHPSHQSYLVVLLYAALGAIIPQLVPVHGGIADPEIGLLFHAIAVVCVISAQTVEFYMHCGVPADIHKLMLCILGAIVASLLWFGGLSIILCDYAGNEHGCVWVPFTYLWPATIVVWAMAGLAHPHHPAASTLIWCQSCNFGACLCMVGLASVLHAGFHKKEDQSFARPFMTTVAAVCFVLIKESAAFIAFIHGTTPQNRDASAALIVGVRAVCSFMQTMLLVRMCGIVGFMVFMAAECVFRAHIGNAATLKFVLCASNVKVAVDDNRAAAANVIQSSVRAYIFNKKFKFAVPAMQLQAATVTIQRAWKARLERKISGSSRLGALGSMIKIKIVTWNSGNAKPFKAELESLLLYKPTEGAEPEPEADMPDILAFGQQESTMDMETGSGEEKWSPKARAMNMIKDRVSSVTGASTEQTTFWNDAIGECLGDGYQLVECTSLGEMRLSLWAKKSVAKTIRAVESAVEATGVAGMVGNKGGIVTKLDVGATSLCFVSCHLAAHEGEKRTFTRNKDCQDIMRGARVGENKAWLDLSAQFDHCFWMGDMNYRVDLNLLDGKTYSADDKEAHIDAILELVEKEDFESLRGADQLNRELVANRVLGGFSSTTIKHVPTFKVNREPGVTYTRQRNPSYCDRILWKSLPGFAHEHRQVWVAPVLATSSSDHKPLAAMHSVLVHPAPAATSDAATMASTAPTTMLAGELGPMVILQDLHAVNLPAMDTIGTSDPFVRFTAAGLLGPTDPETVVIEKECNPSWTQEQIPIMECCCDIKEAAQQHMTISVWDHDMMGPNKFIGAVVVSMYDYCGAEPVPFNLQLLRNGTAQGRIAGTMQVSSPLSAKGTMGNSAMNYKIRKAILKNWVASDGVILSRKTFKFSRSMPLGITWATVPPTDLLLLKNGLNGTTSSVARDFFNAADVRREGTLSVDVCACIIHSMEHHVQEHMALIYLREVHTKKTGSKLHNKMVRNTGINEAAFLQLLEAPRPEEEDPYFSGKEKKRRSAAVLGAVEDDETGLMEDDGEESVSLEDLAEGEEDFTGKWRVLAHATLRAEAAFDSAAVCDVNPDDELVVKEATKLSSGKVRLHTDKGWVSIRSSDGTALVQRASADGTQATNKFYESINFPEFALIVGEIDKRWPESSSKRMRAGLAETRAIAFLFMSATRGAMDREVMSLQQMASYVQKNDPEFGGKKLLTIWAMLAPPRNKDAKRLTFADLMRGCVRLRKMETHTARTDKVIRDTAEEFRTKFLRGSSTKSEPLGLVAVDAVRPGGLAERQSPDELGAEGAGLVVLEVNGRCVVGLAQDHAMDIVERNAEQRPLVLRLARLVPATIAGRSNTLSAPPSGVGPRAVTARRVWAQVHNEDMDTVLDDIMNCWLAMLVECCVPLLAILMEWCLKYGVNADEPSCEPVLDPCSVRPGVFDFNGDFIWTHVFSRLAQAGFAMASLFLVNLNNERASMVAIRTPFSMLTLCSYAAKKQPWLWASQFSAAAALVYTFLLTQYGMTGVGVYAP